MKISVVIATYNRKESLRATLHALEKQRFPKADFEVCVVSDGSTDGTDKMLAEYQHTGVLNLHFFSQENKGPAAARNLAIRSASGEIIAFTDDDCLPNENWLAIIDATFHTQAIVALQGRTYTDSADITPLTHQIENMHGSKDVPTCNAAYTKKVLGLLEGFDENFPYPHNEDADLAWRAEKYGSIGFCPEMLVHHPPRVDRFKKAARRMKIMESEFRLFHKDPASYKKNRSSSLWKNIYWEVGVKTQCYYLKSRFKFLFRPVLMVQGLALTFIWWADLIRFFPKFLKADRVNKQLFSRAS